MKYDCELLNIVQLSESIANVEHNTTLYCNALY